MAEFKIKYQKENGDFHKVLSQRVRDYFKNNQIKKYANAQMVWKTTIQFGVALGSYLFILSNHFHGLDLFILQLIHGFFLFLMSIGIGHDGTHNAYSSSSKVNKAISYVMDLVGIDTNIWVFNHLDSHHSAPNVPLYDSAIDSFVLFRFHPLYQRKPFMRFQHIYIFFLYGFSTLFKWFFYDFFSSMRQRIGNELNVRKKMNHRKMMALILKKLLVFTYALIIPIALVDVPWYQYVFGFICYHFISGIALGVIFQVTHLATRTSFFSPDSKGYLPLSFSEHILRTTADFCPQSRFWTWVSGGLNLHVAHHLFPGVCQIHLPALTEIVKDTAEEFNMPYYAFPSMGAALRSHLNLLKALGGRDNPNLISPKDSLVLVHPIIQGV